MTEAPHFPTGPRRKPNLWSQFSLKEKVRVLCKLTHTPPEAWNGWEESCIETRLKELTE